MPELCAINDLCLSGCIKDHDGFPGDSPTWLRDWLEFIRLPPPLHAVIIGRRNACKVPFLPPIVTRIGIIARLSSNFAM